jgi:hypothetical protein
MAISFKDSLAFRASESDIHRRTYDLRCRALLGHKHPATTARYAHLSADPLRAANDAVGARIAAAMGRRADAIPFEVVGFPIRRDEAGR